MHLLMHHTVYETAHSTRLVLIGRQMYVEYLSLITGYGSHDKKSNYKKKYDSGLKLILTNKVLKCPKKTYNPQKKPNKT